MKRLGWLLFVVLAMGCAVEGVRTASQVGVAIGPEPVCPYGYYADPPYDCAPYGFYGPEWFNSGEFVGAGPWFRGDDHFWGHVDRRYDPRYGYKGEHPNRGDRANRPVNHIENFHGSELRDGHGHERRGER